jgi:hypothetical protein
LVKLAREKYPGEKYPENSGGARLDEAAKSKRWIK